MKEKDKKKPRPRRGKGTLLGEGKKRGVI